MKYSLQLLVLEWKQQRKSLSAVSELLAPESVVVPDFRDTTSLQRLAAALTVKNPLKGAVADMVLAVLIGFGTVLIIRAMAKFEPFDFIISFLSGL